MSNSYYEQSFNPLSNLDSVWSGTSSENNKDKRFSNYYDYYFGGEDIKVYVDGLFEPENELDIASFSYAIKQEKQPLFGFCIFDVFDVFFVFEEVNNSDTDTDAEVDAGDARFLGALCSYPDSLSFTIIFHTFSICGIAF